MNNREIRRHAWDLCKANYGRILKVTVLIQLVNAVIQALCDYFFPTYADTVVSVAEFLLSPVLTIGFLQFMLNIRSGVPADYRDLLTHIHRPMRIWAIQFASTLLTSVYIAVAVVLLGASMAVSGWLTVVAFIAAVTVGVMLLVLMVKLSLASTAFILDPERPAISCLRVSLIAAKGNFWRIVCHMIILSIPMLIATWLCNMLFRDGGPLHTVAMAFCTALCNGYMVLGSLGLNITLLNAGK